MKYLFHVPVKPFLFTYKGRLKLTIYATEVKEVGSTVHLVELKAHLSLHCGDWILPSDAKIIRIHHLQGLGRVSTVLSSFCHQSQPEVRFLSCDSSVLTFHS